MTDDGVPTADAFVGEISPSLAEVYAEWRAADEAERLRAWEQWWRTESPVRYRNANVESVQVPRLSEWLDTATAGGAPPWLMLVGPTGRGKTYAAWAMIRALGDWWRDQGRRPPMLHAHSTSTLLGQLRDIETCQDLHEELGRCWVVLLDDLVTEGGLTPWEAQQVDRIINERYQRELPIIVTSNLPPAELGRAVGERVAGRLAESCWVVPFGGADRRRGDTRAHG